MSKVVLVISANGGVGLAVARRLLAAGHGVVATVSRPEKAAAFQGEAPGCASVTPLDLSAGETVRQVLGELVAGLPRLDGVVVCGAISPFAPAEFTPLDMFRRVMEINCASHLTIYQAVLPALRRSKGRLVFTGSLSGRVATPMMAAYCASKFALEGLVDVMRQEAGAWGVEVVLLQPGNIDTPIVPQARETLARAVAQLEGETEALYGRLYRQMLYRVEEALAQGGMMPPERVAEAALEALEAAVPKTRYRLGPDAEALIEMSRTREDREIDALILDAYRTAPID